jgi:hypothetical protein
VVEGMRLGPDRKWLFRHQRVIVVLRLFVALRLFVVLRVFVVVDADE